MFANSFADLSGVIYAVAQTHSGSSLKNFAYIMYCSVITAEINHVKMLRKPEPTQAVQPASQEEKSATQSLLRACQRGTSFRFEPGASEQEKRESATLAFPDSGRSGSVNTEHTAGSQVTAIPF
jgi:hypothetical protein